MNINTIKIPIDRTESMIKSYLGLLLIKIHIICFSLLMANIAVAIPPTPPIEVEVNVIKKFESLEPSNGRFVVPVQINANRYIENSKLIVKTTKMGQLGQRKTQTRQYNIRALQKGDHQVMSIKLPVQKNAGLYRTELQVELNHGIDKGLVNKQILIQKKTAGQARLMTPADLRHQQVKANYQEFWKTKTKNRPNIKLLTNKLTDVPELSKPQIRSKKNARIKHKQTGAAELPETMRPYILDKAKQLNAGNQNGDQQNQISSLTIIPPLVTQAKGTVVFEDFYTDISCNPFDINDPYYPCDDIPPVLTPLANATVVLLVDDPSGFDFGLGATVTDEDGDWAINIDPSFLGSDLYYTVSLDNTEFTVRDDTGTNYVWTSDTLLAGPGPFFPNIVNFGQQTMTDNIEAAQVFNVMNTGWNHIVDQGGADPANLDKLEVRYPDACTVNGSPSSCWDFIPEIVRIEADYNDGPDLILHEYGHALQFYAFGGNPVSGGSHSFDDVTQTSSVAYGEGWATAYALSVCPDEYFSWHDGTYEGVNEWPVCAENFDYGEWIEGFRFPTASANRDGELHEGRVAATLFDFMDGPNDDNNNNESQGKNNYEDANENDLISIETIFGDHMWGYDFNSFINYFIHLRTGLNTTQQSLADDILTYNWMSWPITVPWPETLCVASKVAMALSPEYAQVLKGLRFFRDQLMKPLQEGRDWIQSYYSHSPEMAILLIKNAQAREAGKTLVEHFSQIGYRIDEADGLGNLASSQQRVMPNNVLKAINTITKVINENGSPALKQKLNELRVFIQPFRSMSMSQAVDRVNSMARVLPGKDAQTIAPLKFAPGSQNADWELIYKNIPASEKPD